MPNEGAPVEVSLDDSSDLMVLSVPIEDESGRICVDRSSPADIIITVPPNNSAPPAEVVIDGGDQITVSTKDDPTIVVVPAGDTVVIDPDDDGQLVVWVARSASTTGRPRIMVQAGKVTHRGQSIKGTVRRGDL